MNMAAIIITAYLLLGAVAGTILWAVLIVSRRRDRKNERFSSYNPLEYSPFRERKTKPSRSH